MEPQNPNASNGLSERASETGSHPDNETLTPPPRRGFAFLGCTLFDVIAVLVIVSAFAYLADWRRLNPGSSLLFRHDMSSHIGAEYDTIAQAIRAGRGFSDPFRTESGPTAWMPPVLVYFTAALYWLTGDRRESVVELIVLCNFLSVLFGSLMVMGYARRTGLPRIGILVLCLGLAADFYDMFQKTHDTWILLLVINLTWIGLQSVARRSLQRSSLAFLWGIFGGLVALTGPIAGFAWGAATTIQWIFQNKIESGAHLLIGLLRRAKHIAIPLGICALGAILTVSPWVIRNRIVMGKWIPVKSNATYEVWQSQLLDEDGVLDTDSLSQHPWARNGEQRARYVEVGELAFIADA